MRIVSLLFLRKKWLQTIIVFAKKLCDNRDYNFSAKQNFRDNCDNREAIIAIVALSRFVQLPWKTFPSTASALSTAFCPVYDLCPFCSPLSPLQPSVPCMALYPSMALCPLYGPLSPLRLSAPSTTFYPFYCKVLCFLNSTVSYLRPLCPF
jgi:hypothetical protein